VARAPAEGRVPTEVVCPELYVKPDDRWEVNNVTVRCLDVVECLQDALIQYDQAVQSGRTSDLPPLSDVLLRGLG
jgi:hypothetical protein